MKLVSGFSMRGLLSEAAVVFAHATPLADAQTMTVAQFTFGTPASITRGGG
jgi:hypothetical protein